MYSTWENAISFLPCSRLYYVLSQLNVKESRKFILPCSSMRFCSLHVSQRWFSFHPFTHTMIYFHKAKRIGVRVNINSRDGESKITSWSSEKCECTQNTRSGWAIPPTVFIQTPHTVSHIPAVTSASQQKNAKDSQQRPLVLLQKKVTPAHWSELMFHTDSQADRLHDNVFELSCQFKLYSFLGFIWFISCCLCFY